MTFLRADLSLSICFQTKICMPPVSHLQLLCRFLVRDVSSYSSTTQCHGLPAFIAACSTPLLSLRGRGEVVEGGAEEGEERASCAFSAALEQWRSLNKVEEVAAAEPINSNKGSS